MKKPICDIIGEPGKQWAAEILSKPTAEAIRSAYCESTEWVCFTLSDLGSVKMQVRSLQENTVRDELRMTIEGVAFVETGMWWWKKKHIIQITVILYPDIPINAGRNLATLVYSGIAPG